MKAESVEKSLGTKSFLRFDLLVASFCGLFTLAHFFSSFFPKSRLWGINHLAYFPLWVRLTFTFLGLLILVPGVNSRVYRFIEQILSFLQKLFSKKKILGYAFTSLIFMFLFWLMRTRTHFLGDGTLAMNLLEQGKLFIKWSEPLEIFSHLYLYKFLNLFFIPPAESIYAGLSILAGGIFIFILFFLTKTISENRFDRFFVFFIFLFSGATQLFLGYAEHYTLAYVSVFAYLYFSLRYIQGKVKIFLPILFCLLSIGFHFSSAYLLPSLFFLFILRRKNQELVFSLKRVFPYVLILILVSILTIYYVRSKNPILLEIFVPLLSGRPYAPEHTLFSFPHLLDILNQHLLLSPVGIILLLSTGMVFKNRIRFINPIVPFLVIVSIAQLFYHFAVDPKLGAGRDWDLFSDMGLTYTLLGIYLFIRLSQSNRYAATILVFTALLSTSPWFALNANTEKGIERFRDLLDLDLKRSFSGRNTLVYYFQQQKRFTEVERIQTEISKAFPEDSLTRAARTHIELGDFDKAEELLKKAIEINPRFTTAYNDLGRIYFHRGETDRALELFQELILSNPLNSAVHLNLAHALLDKGRLEEALLEFKRAEKLGEESADIYCDMAYIHLNFGETEEAVNLYKKALEIEPGLYPAHFVLGQIYLERNYLNEALVEFERVIRLKPDYAPAYYNLGMVYSGKGLKEKAIQEFELFLKYSPDVAQKEKVRGWIQKLRSMNP